MKNLLSTAAFIGIAVAMGCHAAKAQTFESGIITWIQPSGGSSTSSDDRPCFFYVIGGGGNWRSIPYGQIGASAQIAVITEARLSTLKGNPIVVDEYAYPGLPGNGPNGCNSIPIADGIGF